MLPFPAVDDISPTALSKIPVPGEASASKRMDFTYPPELPVTTHHDDILAALSEGLDAIG